MKIKRNILLNPGPATTSDSVKLAQVVPDICPREEEFAIIVNDLRTDLTSIVTELDDRRFYDTVFIGGSGTAVMDAIISTVVTEKVLVINNGAYGNRAVEIAKAYNIEFEEFTSSNSSQINIETLRSSIAQMDEKPSHLVSIHHETTTGLLNDISQIGKICRDFNIEFIVDAISSYAAIEINMKKMNISYLAGTSNKNLQGMAGIAFCVFEKQALLNKENASKRNYYLNLLDQYKNFSSKNQLRFTPPVQTFYALKQAVDETLKEGVAQRYLRYSSMWQRLDDGLRNLGLDILVKEEDSSKLMTTIFEPNITNFSFDHMHDYFYQKGITIYPGKVSDLNTFRIANIGQLDVADIDTFLLELTNYLESKETHECEN